MGTLLYIDPLFYNKLLSEFVSDDSNVNLGKVLSNYILTVTTTIHGTIGLSALDHVFVDNVINGVRGIYYISEIQEELRPDNFNTTLTMKQARPL